MESFSKKGWNVDTYYGYRRYVVSKAESYRGKTQDCADLSMTLLIDFAAENGLMLTFIDNDYRMYMSKAEAVITTKHRQYNLDPDDESWSSKQKYTEVVLRRIGVEALWKRNTMVNDPGPTPGDLMILWTKSGRHHAGLVYRGYLAGQTHPKRDDKNVPNFPGSDEAMDQSNQTEYFKGTVDSDGKTINRNEVDTTEIHFDYLNSRGDAKRNAELIYFANARQAREDGFEFRKYSPHVIDNWSEWNGQGLPPISTHFR
jgi:hypothetical protein